MFLLITVVGVVLGYACAGAVNRRFGPGDARRWVLLVPVWVVYVVVLFTADMQDVWAQGVQCFALASFLDTVINVSITAVRRSRHRRVDRVR